MNRTYFYIILFGCLSILFSCKANANILASTNDSKQTPEGVQVRGLDCSRGVVLNNIKFGKLSDKLFSSSNSSLDHLANTMLNRKYLKINIVSYYSDYNNEKYNEKLAKKRAISIKKYLIRKGVDKKRVSTEGFGDQISSADYVQENGKTKMIKVYYRKDKVGGYSNLIILKKIKFGKLSDRLFSSSNPTLERLAKYLDEYKGLDILVHSYTDNQGDADFNKRLSQRRAQVIKQFLVSQKIDANRITVEGRGERNPILPNSTEAGRKKNNRIEVSFKARKRKR